jgi:hypothetical protein
MKTYIWKQEDTFQFQTKEQGCFWESKIQNWKQDNWKKENITDGSEVFQQRR